MTNRGDSSRLLLTPSLQAPVDSDGAIWLTQKFLSGATRYAELWDGPVSVMVEPTPTRSVNLDNVRVGADSVPFELLSAPFDSREMRRQLDRADVVLSGMTYRTNHLAKWAAEADVPLLYTTEYTLETRLLVARAQESHPLKLARRCAWELSQERRQRKAILLAAGLQCNGTPTYQAYRDLNENAHLYFDTRVHRNELVQASEIEERFARRSVDEPLRLVFSGRLDRMKGVHHLPDLADSLRARGLAFRLDVFGDGPEYANLVRELSNRQLAQVVTLRGNVDFASELLPRLKVDYDIFVCTHVQGDPSCTYLETMATGLPIVGFANEAFEGILANGGAGYAVPLGDVEALARSIHFLSERLDLVQAGARAALDFAREHSFEDVFAGRIAHLQRTLSSFRPEKKSFKSNPGKYTASRA